MINLIGSLELLDWIIGWFFFTQTLTWPGPQGHSSQGRFFFCLRHIVPNGHIWSKKVISGPDFLKNDDIWSYFIKLDQIGSNERPEHSTKSICPTNDPKKKNA